MLWIGLQWSGSSLPVMKLDQKFVKGFEMWCWRRMEISWTDRVKSEEVW